MYLIHRRDELRASKIMAERAISNDKIDIKWFIDGKTGRVARKFETPVLKNSQHQGWGFISRYKNQLLGTVVDPAAVYTKWCGKTQWFDSTGGADTHVVAGEQLFSMDPETGKPLISA